MLRLVQVFAVFLAASPALSWANRAVAFSVDLAVRQPVLAVIHRGATFEFAMTDGSVHPSGSVSRGGSGLLKVADSQLLVPQCVARLIQSSQASDVDVELIKELGGRKLPVSAVQLTFRAGADAPPGQGHTTRLQILLGPLMLLGVEQAPAGGDRQSFRMLRLSELCHDIELAIMTERPRQ